MQFLFGGLIHVDAGGVAKGCERHDDAPNLLAHVTFRPAEHVFHKFECLRLGAGVRLSEFERFFKEAMITLLHIEVRRCRKARDNPLPNAVLKRA
ncbi:hypothetical protein RFM98_29035 [Mesorhizobium sp. VK9D]|uniref:hypothetical protein n=1 Tax=Mesorhizobium australafricanum TaxID=3072311 RepID=UPI002A2458A1|nr:hypothetical protein [Mesorhizobium sp. VK9D]MDX8456789.1 hypothetical protein [Mesorhizobium sp. VK9D]